MKRFKLISFGLDWTTTAGSLQFSHSWLLPFLKSKLLLVHLPQRNVCSILGMLHFLFYASWSSTSQKRLTLLSSLTLLFWFRLWKCLCGYLILRRQRMWCYRGNGTCKCFVILLRWLLTYFAVRLCLGTSGSIQLVWLFALYVQCFVYW